MSRAQLKHLLLDINFKDKAKVIDLEETFNPLARLLVIDIMSCCSGATNAQISRNTCRFLGKRIGIAAESVEAILDFCIENEILSTVRGLITNSRVIKDQESYFNKLESDRNRKNKRDVESTRNPTGNESGIRPPPDIDSDIDNDLLDNKLILHGQFNTPEIQEALKACAARLKKSGRTVDQQLLDATCMNISTPERLLKAFWHTAGLSFSKNIYEPSDKSPQNTKQTNFDRNKETILKSLKEAEEREQSRNN